MNANNASPDITSESGLKIGEIRRGNTIVFGGYRYKLIEVHENFVRANLIPIILGGSNCKTRKQPSTPVSVDIPTNVWKQFELISGGLITNSTIPQKIQETNQLLHGLTSQLESHSPNSSED